MKLYMHPVSTATRPVRLFIAEKKIPVTEQIVDLGTGEHYKDEYTAINPSRMVPTLEDGDLRLTESSAILKYLASKIDAPEYPKDLKKRAKVDEAMDWFNTQFYRDFGYGLALPADLPAPQAVDRRGAPPARSRGARTRRRPGSPSSTRTSSAATSTLPTTRSSIADYFGACIVTAGELIGCTYDEYPNVQRWLGERQEARQLGEGQRGHARLREQR